MVVPRARHRHFPPYLMIFVPIMVHIVGTIIQDCVFGGLISFLSPISPNLYLVNNINTDVIYMCHLQHLLDLRLATQTKLPGYINYLRYPQQSLKSFFGHCNFTVLFKLLYTWNLIDICKIAYWKNVWESYQLIGKYN